MDDSTFIDKSPAQSCPAGKYWISPHERKRIDKHGKAYVQHVTGYCCCYHGPFQKLAEE